MEVIRRKILLEDSVDRNTNSSTYGTLTATSFYLKVMLTQSGDDMGMFTDMSFVQANNTIPDYSPLVQKLSLSGLSFPFMSGITPSVTASEYEYALRLTGTSRSDYYHLGGLRLTGFTDSKLEDVKAYDAVNPYQVGFDTDRETYVNYSGGTIVGVNRVVSVGILTGYVAGTDKNDPFIGTTGQTAGLLYEDLTGQTRVSALGTLIPTTTVSYIGEGFNETNTSLSALTKQEYLFGIVSPPEVKNDIFIDRGVTSVMDRHLKLSEISNLSELARYGNGFYKINKQ